MMISMTASWGYRSLLMRLIRHSRRRVVENHHKVEVWYALSVANLGCWADVWGQML
jgi:hypothetical protein